MAHRILTLGEITDGFDVILSDVWGVLHNGVSAFPHAAVALHEARKAGKTVVLITNSPRPAPGVIAQLRVLGVPDEAYDRIITSGDVTRGLIAEGPKKVFLLGPERDMPLLEGLDVERVGEAEAQSVVCTGFFDDETETPEDYTEMLKGFIARKVPMICANPDLVVERGERIIPCAGAENEFTTFTTARWAEVAKNIALTEHAITVRPLVGSAANLAKLSPEQQSAIRDAAKEVADWDVELEGKLDEENKAKLAADFGVTYTTPDKAPMLAASSAIIKAFADETGVSDLADKIAAAAN